MVRRSPLYGSNHHCYGALPAKWAAQYFRAHGAPWFKALKHHAMHRCSELGLSRRNTAQTIFRAERGAGKGESRASRRCLFGVTAHSCDSCGPLLRSGCFVHACRICNLSCPRLFPSTILSARVRWKGRDCTATAVAAMLPQCSPSLFILHRCTLERLYTVAASIVGCNGRFPGGI